MAGVAPALAQAPEEPPPVNGPQRLNGPRVGVTILSPGAVERINEEFGEYDFETGAYSQRIDPNFPVITQFGWQYERRLFQSASGVTGVTEFVPLIGGLERGLFLPSVSFVVGVRAPGGFEAGVGPNLSLSGAAYALAIGHSRNFGDFTVPVNAAVVLGQGGPRISLLVGFTVSSGRY